MPCGAGQYPQPPELEDSSGPVESVGTKHPSAVSLRTAIVHQLWAVGADHVGNQPHLLAEV